ncbi:MAG: hypothetical protein Q8R76_12710 [Candidatus Omnitrophota bacterium]|nr:hypothetical protein [Candidatus Omnitrophota bacterium]
MLYSAMILGALTLVFGCLLLFGREKLKAMSDKLNRVVLAETWMWDHRVAIGILLIGLSGFLFAGAYFLVKFNS